VQFTKGQLNSDEATFSSTRPTYAWKGKHPVVCKLFLGRETVTDKFEELNERWQNKLDYLKQQVINAKTEVELAEQAYYSRVYVHLYKAPDYLTTTPDAPVLASRVTKANDRLRQAISEMEAELNYQEALVAELHRRLQDPK
jgi:hypothetical protein